MRWVFSQLKRIDLPAAIIAGLAGGVAFYLTMLIDLKIGKLTHRDVGQMDGYVRTFEDQFKVAGDNPTIGLILCSDKSEAVAKYSILSEAKQVFASKYLPFLPTEEELQLELQRERKLIEAAIEDASEGVTREDS